MSFLSVKGLKKTYPGERGKQPLIVFEELNFDIEQGEFVTIVGHSGCGKSTLLNIVAGLERPTEGRITLDGKAVRGPGLERGVVFQGFALMPWLTVFDNVRLAVEAAFPQWDREKVRRYTQEQIDLVGLARFEWNKPASLSGGMKQRVGLARALAVKPKVLLLDEPFAQIDALTRWSIQEELLRMWSVTRNTVLMVTHDVEEAILLSDRVMLMTRGPAARIAEVVEVSIPRPRSRDTLDGHPEYGRIRKRILSFLKREGGEG